MGGRIATMVGGMEGAQDVAGVVCPGYPLHPIGKPDRARLDPLLESHCRSLICQGDRDPFGNRQEFEALGLPDHVEIAWLEDGDHDFGPRGSSPASHRGNLQTAAAAVRDFVVTLRTE